MRANDVVKAGVKDELKYKISRSKCEYKLYKSENLRGGENE